MDCLYVTGFKTKKHIRTSLQLRYTATSQIACFLTEGNIVLHVHLATARLDWRLGSMQSNNNLAFVDAFILPNSALDQASCALPYYHFIHSISQPVNRDGLTPDDEFCYTNEITYCIRARQIFENFIKKKHYWSNDRFLHHKFNDKFYDHLH